MREYKELLSEISAACRALNEAAEAASDTIAEVEKKLLDAQPGITVWHGTLLQEPTTFTAEDGGEQDAERRVTLGFAKVKSGGKWGIAVRDEVYGKKKPRDAKYTELLAGEVASLRKGDRELRILAVPMLMGLLQDILAALKSRAAALTPAGDGGADDVEAGMESGVGTEDAPTAAADLEEAV